MSRVTLYVCDCEDCYNNQNNIPIYDLSYGAQKIILTKRWYATEDKDDMHICRDCCMEYISNYDELELDEVDDILRIKGEDT